MNEYSEHTVPDDELVVAVEEIMAARGRGEQPSDSTGGRSDLNDT